MDTIGVPDMIEIMRDEGLSYGAELADQMVPGGSNSSWISTVNRIYDAEKMQATVAQAFYTVLADVDLAPLSSYFNSDDGQTVIGLELSARRAMADEAVEQSARDAYKSLIGSESTRLEAIDVFIERQNLIEANVEGALNANFMFYKGLVDGEAIKLSEQDILAEVWGQEGETRSDTTEWLFGYLLMAYGPLSDAQLAEYDTLYNTDEGRALNRALFNGFNTMYDSISYGLGLAIAHQMAGEDL